MADEITTPPDTGAIPQFDFGNNSSSNIPIPENNYDPRPKAINVYDKVVGNPLTGSNPGANYTPSTDVAKLIKDSNSYKDALFSSAERTGPADPAKNMKPFTYNGDYDGANFERYYNSKPFKELGFNPYRDNESLYNNNMTTGDEFTRAASQWPSLVSTGFMSGVRSWGTIFTDPLAPDVQGAEDMQRAMAIGSATKPGVSSFLINTALNSGYTIGIGAEMLAETLAIAGATAATGGLDAEITLPLWMTRMAGGAAKAAKGAEIIGELGKAKNISALKSFWDNTRTGQILAKAGGVLNPLERTWELGKDLASGANALKYADQAAGTINQFARWSKNFGEFAKDMVMIKAAVSEAQLEGGMIQMDVTKDLIAKYKEENNGNEPVGEELARIENIAKEESHRTAFWNLPAIMWSNKFMYETMFAPFEKTAKKGIENIADDILFKEGKGFTAVAEGVTGKLQKIKAGITSPKQWGNFGYNYLKQNSAEGIQENIQEAISLGAKEHALHTYNNPDRGAYEGYMSHFLNGAKQQFSAQGAETFAGGFVMGAMAHPFMAAPMWAGETVWNNTVNKGKYEEYQKQRKEQLDQSTKVLNEFYKDAGKYFAPDMVNALKQGQLQKDFYNANMDNDRKKAEDAKSLSQFEHLYTALSTGKFDILINKFKTFKEFSPEKAAEAFHVTDGAQALTMLDDVVARAQQLKGHFEDVSSSYPNPYDPFRYKKGTEEHFAQQNAYSAWEEGKKNLIFARTEFENHNKRIQGLADTLIGKRNPLKNTNAQDLLTLMDKGQMAITITSLKLDRKTSDSNTPEGRKIIAEKTKRIELLEKLGNSFTALSIPTLGAGMAEKTIVGKELKKTFKEYINHIAGTSGDIVFDNELEHALELIKDNYTLRDERASLVKSINVLSNPRGFLNLHRNLAAIYADIENTKDETIKKNLAQFANNKQLNNAINDLFKTAGVILTPSYSEYLKTAIENNQVIELPTAYIDATSPNLDTITDVTNPKFIKAQTEWTRISKAIQAEDAKEPVKSAPVVTPGTVKGKLIYATKGSGKSTYVKENSQDYVDADELIVAEIKKFIKSNPEIGEIPTDENPQATIFNFTINVSKKEKDDLYDVVRGQITNLLNQGKTVLTGSTAFIKDADLVYLQEDATKIGLEPVELVSLREKERAALSASGKSADKISGYIGTKLDIKTIQTREDIEQEKKDKLNNIRVDVLKLPANAVFYFGSEQYAIVTKGTTLEDTIVGPIPFGDEEPATVLNGYTFSKDPSTIINDYKRKIAELDAQEEVITSTPAVVEKPTIPFEIKLSGGRKASFNKESKYWEFKTKNGKLITNAKQIEKLSSRLATIPNIVSIWWTYYLNNTTRAEINKEYESFFSILQGGATSGDDVFVETPEVAIMKSIQGVKFKLNGDVDNNTTDVNKKVWFAEDGYGVDDLVEMMQDRITESGGAHMDEQAIINAIYDIVNEYPEGIKDKDWKTLMTDSNPNKELSELESKFINTYGIDIGISYQKLDELKLLDYEDIEPTGTIEATTSSNEASEVPEVISTDVEESEVKVSETVKDSIEKRRQEELAASNKRLLNSAEVQVVLDDLIKNNKDINDVATIHVTESEAKKADIERYKNQTSPRVNVKLTGNKYIDYFIQSTTNIDDNGLKGVLLSGFGKTEGQKYIDAIKNNRQLIKAEQLKLHNNNNKDSLEAELKKGNIKSISIPSNTADANLSNNSKVTFKTIKGEFSLSNKIPNNKNEYTFRDVNTGEVYILPLDYVSKIEYQGYIIYDAELALLNKEPELVKAEYTSMSDKIRVPGKGIVKGMMVTYPTMDAPNTFFVYQDKKKDGGLFNLMLPQGSGASLAISDISEEDVIQKGFDILSEETVQFEKIDIGVQLNTIKDIKTFDEFDSVYDTVKQVTNNQSIDIDLIINKAFDKKEAELFYTKTGKNLLAAQKKGYKLKIGDGIYTNFTVNSKTVSVSSAMGTVSTNYPFSKIDFITKMSAKEPTPVTPETKTDIKTAVEGSNTILSSSALQDANEEAKTKTIDQALTEFDESIGCE